MQPDMRTSRLRPDMRTLRPWPLFSALAMLALLGATAPGTAAAQGGACPDDLEREIAERINAERTSRGLAPLVVDVRLAEAARGHSADMAADDFFSHTGSNGSHFADRMSAAGYAWLAAGETVAAGYATPAEVVAGWMESTPHRGILLSAAYRHVGVGAAYDARASYRFYYTADFGDTGGTVESADDVCAAAAACANGVDDDGDGDVDFGADSGCAPPADAWETADCADGIDNDGDGRVDFGSGPTNDPGCPLDWGRFVENPECSDGIDNDGDGSADLADAQCGGAPWQLSESPGTPACGLGFEAAPILVLLGRARRRRARERV